MNSSREPLCILMSGPAVDAYGTQIRAAVEPYRPVEFVRQEVAGPAPSAAALERVTVAYLSTELIGRYHEPDPDIRLREFSASLRAAPNLRWLHICSAGTDRPLFHELHARGVVMTHSSGANALSVAHTALAGMLALARDVPLWVRAQARREWVPQRHEASPRDLDGNQVVVIGTGAIGQALARACQALDMRTLGVRRSAEPVPFFDEVVAQQDLESVLPRADWLVVACPLTEATRNLIDAERLAMLPKGARLINIGRGAIVDEDALLVALQSGRLAGAYLDVFAQEPLPPDSPLWAAPQLLISAHNAGAVQGFGPRATAIFVENLPRWLRESALRNRASFG